MIRIDDENVINVDMGNGDVLVIEGKWDDDSGVFVSFSDGVGGDKYGPHAIGEKGPGDGSGTDTAIGARVRLNFACSESIQVVIDALEKARGKLKERQCKSCLDEGVEVEMRAKRERDAARAEADQLRAEVAALRSVDCEHCRADSEAAAERDAARARVAELEAKLDQPFVTLEVMRSRVRELETDRDRLRGALQASRDRVAELEGRVERLREMRIEDPDPSYTKECALDIMEGRR